MGAENYEFGALANFKTFHPEAPHEITSNTLIVGSAGAGKSMLMRQFSWQLYNSSTVLPLYVHAERWVSLPLSESLTTARGASSGVAKSRAQIVATYQLGLGILWRIGRVIGPQAGLEATRIFPGDIPGRADQIERWIFDRLRSASEALRWGGDLDPEIRVLGPLRELLEHFASVVHRLTGKRLLLFLDQLDRVTPTYFEVLAPALGRTTEYHLVVACRPSPCAPEQTSLHLSVGDCETFWLGEDWNSDSWRDFLVSAARDSFPGDLVDAVEEHADFLARLVGPSTRHFMRILLAALRSDPEQKEFAEALAKATTWMKNSFESELEATLAGYKSTSRFLRNLKDEIARATVSPKYYPERLLINPDEGLYFQVETERRLRIAVREGLLVPVPASGYGLDQISLEYKTVPLACTRTPSHYLGLELLTDSVEVSEEQFLSWSTQKDATGHASEKTERDSLFYSALPGDTRLIETIRPLVGPFTDVSVGPGRPHGVDAAVNRGRLKSANLCIIQAEPLRALAAIETGWAIGNNQPVLWFVRADTAPSLPLGIGTVIDAVVADAAETPRLAATILETIEAAAAAPSGVWSRDAQDEPLMEIDRNLAQVLVLGAGSSASAVASRVNEALSLEAHDRCRFVDVADQEAPGQLLELFRLSKSATVLVASLTGSVARDFWTLVGLGIHTHSDNDRRVKVNRRKYVSVRRRVLVVRPDAPGATGSDFLATLPDAVINSDVEIVARAAAQTFADFRGKL
jgi:hypothetical protein